MASTLLLKSLHKTHASVSVQPEESHDRSVHRILHVLYFSDSGVFAVPLRIMLLQQIKLELDEVSERLPTLILLFLISCGESLYLPSGSTSTFHFSPPSSNI